MELKTSLRKVFDLGQFVQAHAIFGIEARRGF